MAVGLAQGHEDTRHKGKMKGHMAFVLVTEIRPDVRWPLVRLGQKHACLVVLVEETAQFFQHGVGLGEVLVDRTLTLAQVGYGVQAQAIHADIKPETHSPKDGLQDLRVGVIQIGLMREKTMPIVCPCHRVPGPVRLFRIQEDDAGPGILRIRIAPDIVVPFA